MIIVQLHHLRDFENRVQW